MRAQKRISRRIFTASIAISLLCVTAFDLQAQTQSGMNQTACSPYKQADEALNDAYTKILKGYAKDAQFVAKLKQAQRAWIAFAMRTSKLASPKQTNKPNMEALILPAVARYSRNSQSSVRKS